MGKLMIGVIVAGIVLPRCASADATTEAELRAALQNVTSQIAGLQDQVAHLQAAQAPELATITSLRAQLQAAAKPAAPVESSADKAKATAALAAADRRLANEAVALDKSQAAYRQAQTAAGAATAQNSDLSARLTAANGTINSCNAKNAALFQTGNKILDAYAHKDDLFGTIANKEPFIGFNRVKLQNIVQDDQDKLNDNQINP